MKKKDTEHKHNMIIEDDYSDKTRHLFPETETETFVLNFSENLSIGAVLL